MATPLGWQAGWPARKMGLSRFRWLPGQWVLTYRVGAEASHDFRSSGKYFVGVMGKADYWSVGCFRRRKTAKSLSFLSLARVPFAWVPERHRTGDFQSVGHWFKSSTAYQIVSSTLALPRRGHCAIWGPVLEGSVWGQIEITTKS